MERELNLSTPHGLTEPVRELLQASPGVRFSERAGLTQSRFQIAGTDAAIAQLEPQLQALEQDYVSREAW